MLFRRASAVPLCTVRWRTRASERRRPGGTHSQIRKGFADARRVVAGVVDADGSACQRELGRPPSTGLREVEGGGHAASRGRRPRSRQPTQRLAPLDLPALRPRRAPLATHGPRARLRRSTPQTPLLDGDDARHRKTSRPRIHTQPPATAHALRALRPETAPGLRRAARLLLRPPRGATHTHAASPRALGRSRLPAPPRRRRHSLDGPHRAGRRLLRRDGRAPRIQLAAHARRRVGGTATRVGPTVRPARGRSFPRHILRRLVKAMNTWMRRRIERSRARCEKAATNYKTDKRQPQASKPQTNSRTQSAPSES